MDNVSVPNSAEVPIPPASPIPMICPQCHQPVPANAYYCPNCGKKLSEPPLSTSFWAQAWLYAFSIVLPIICYLAISYWQGWKYFKSDDPKAQQMGLIAIALLTLSSIITFWLGFVWLQQTVQSSVNSVGNL